MSMKHILQAVVTPCTMHRGVALTLVALMSSTAAFAQIAAAKTDIELDEIVVTATKRKDTILVIPQSVQAVSGATLERLGATSLQDVVNKLPGVSGYANGTGRSSFNIRGIQSFSGGVIDASTVGFYLDETPLANAAITPDVTLYDLERVEVLRGPQGTLYGEGSLGGTIRLVTKRPDFSNLAGEVFGDISSTASGGENYRASGVINVPIVTDKAAFRLVGTYLKDGGFIDDARTKQPDVNKSEFYNLRAALRLRPLDRLDIQFGYTRQKGDGGPEALQSPGLDLAVNQAFQQTFKDRFDLGSVTANLSLDALDVVYAGSYYNRSRTESLDDLGTAAAIEDQTGLPIVAGVRENTTSPEKVWTQELRIVSNGDTALNWLAGAYYKNRNVRLIANTLAPDIAEVSPAAVEVFRSDVDLRFTEIAAFGEASYRLTPELKATAGVRIFRQTNRGTTDTRFLAGISQETGEPEFAETGTVPINQKTSDVLFKASIDYKPNDNMLLYALFSQGVRGGGVNTRLFSAAIPRTYGSDSVNNYELGLKLRALDGALTLNSALFNIDWKDIQTAVRPQPGINYIVNAGKARSRGVEVDINYKLAKTITIGGGYSHIDSKLSTAITAVAATAESSAIIAPPGSPLAGVTRDKASIFIDARIPVSEKVSAFVRTDLEYVGPTPSGVPLFVGNTLIAPAPILPEYVTASLRLGLEFTGVTVTAYISNLTNERALLSDDSSSGSLVNRPRSIGINAKLEF